MRIRKKKWADKELENSGIYLSDPAAIVDWFSLFENDNPVSIELGCGKGCFIAEYAWENQDRNFIAIDIKKDMLAVANRNIYGRFREHLSEPRNVILVNYDITYIENLFGDSFKADDIFINFPNPWYKAKHHKRRLTYPDKLRQYLSILKEDGRLYLKTDDEAFFTDTAGYLRDTGFMTLCSTSDYYGDISEEHRLPPSEHERLFRNNGDNIYFLVAKRGGL